MIHKHNPDWSSHIPILVRALQITNGPVLELGMGIGSTPLLHALCYDRYRQLVSYENDERFVNDFKKFRTSFHDIIYVDDWDKVNVDEYKWGVVLVDHKPDDRRQVEIKRLVDKAEFIVIHDSQPEDNSIFEYENIYNLFKYRYDYTKFKTHTSALSNVREFIYE